jgi:3-hydroxy-9,10-secoandrosta-1,3,5(10)-triene-9,17-dione monooxygenase reductase component
MSIAPSSVERSAVETLSIDPLRFRKAIGSFATGVAIVTTVWQGRYYGMTINSLTSLSLDPCMLLVCPKRGSSTGLAIQNRGEFAVNILADHQRELSKRFVGNVPDRFADLDLSFSESGLPLLPGSLAHICCRLAAVHEGGDHEIIVGEVMSCTENAGDPLLFHKGSFGSLCGGNP